MEIDTAKPKHTIKGGRTIIGKIAQYQERTNASYNEVLNMPYSLFIIASLDAPHIDYDSKNEDEEKVYKPETVADEIAALTGQMR